MKPPSLLSSFTSSTHYTTLHLNAFRGVRAISEFDWPFTPIHRSSENFSTFTSSVLHSETIGTSTCPWIDHSVSRLPRLTIALLRLAFAMLPYLKYLGCQTGVTRRLIMQKARRHQSEDQLRPLVSVRFQGLFTPLLRVLFTFPLRYWFAIGLSVVFRLSGWCRQIQTGFLQPRPTQDTAMYNEPFAYRTITSYGLTFQLVQLNSLCQSRSPTTPMSTLIGLACSAFARHYLRNHFCFLFLSLLRCFSSGGLRLLSPQLHCGGLPHSDTYGSTLVCNSP